MNDYEYWLLFLSILFSGLFSGIEIAFLQADKLRIAIESNNSFSLQNKIISFFVGKKELFITNLLIGNNISVVIYSIYMSKLIIYLLFNEYYNIEEIPNYIIIIQTVLSTIIILFSAEYLPKILFRIKSNFYLKLFSVPLYIIYLLLYPLTKFVSFITNIFLKLARVEKTNNNVTFNKIDLEHFIENFSDSKKNEISSKQILLFKNALTFNEKKARECLIPRTEIIATEIGTSVENLKNIFIQTGLSKVLIYNSNIDNIIGYIHSYDLFEETDNIKHKLRPIQIVPESIKVNEMLKKFISNGQNIAVVVDEYGGTAGLITLEDVIELIFGEIDDEHDEEILTENKINENEFIFSGRQEIEYIKQKFNLDFTESSEYETISGYILHKLKRFPELNEKIICDEKYEVEIINMSKMKIEEVKVTILNY